LASPPSPFSQALSTRSSSRHGEGGARSQLLSTSPANRASCRASNWRGISLTRQTAAFTSLNVAKLGQSLFLEARLRFSTSLTLHLTPILLMIPRESNRNKLRGAGLRMVCGNALRAVNFHESAGGTAFSELSPRLPDSSRFVGRVGVPVPRLIFPLLPSRLVLLSSPWHRMEPASVPCNKLLTHRYSCVTKNPGRWQSLSAGLHLLSAPGVCAKIRKCPGG
jgi:hypothetical protein